MNENSREDLIGQLDTLANRGKVFLERTAKARSRTKVWNRWMPWTVVSPVLVLCLSLWLPVAFSITLLFALPCLIMGIGYGCYVRKISISRQQALAVFGSQLADKDRITIADEFIGETVPSPLRRLAIEDAKSTIQKALSLTEISLPVPPLSEPLPKGRRWNFISVILLSVLVAGYCVFRAGDVVLMNAPVSVHTSETPTTEDENLMDTESDDKLPLPFSPPVDSKKLIPENIKSQINSENDSRESGSSTPSIFKGQGNHQIQPVEGGADLSASLQKTTGTDSGKAEGANNSASTAGNSGTEENLGSNADASTTSQKTISEPAKNADSGNNDASSTYNEAGSANQESSKPAMTGEISGNTAAKTPQANQRNGASKDGAGQSKQGSNKSKNGEQNGSQSQSQGNGGKGQRGNKSHGTNEALKKTRGVAELLLAVPMADKLIGSPGSGQEATTQQLSNGKLSQTSSNNQVNLSQTAKGFDALSELTLSAEEKELLQRLYHRENAETKFQGEVNEK